MKKEYNLELFSNVEKSLNMKFILDVNIIGQGVKKPNEIIIMLNHELIS
jgi:hypothetical protein